MDKLNTYIIEITETLQKQIDIQAENINDAVQQAHEMYDEEKIVLDSDDLVNLDICSLTKESEFCKHKNLKQTGYSVKVNSEIKNEFLCYDCGLPIFK